MKKRILGIVAAALLLQSGVNAIEETNNNSGNVTFKLRLKWLVSVKIFKEKCSL